MCYAYLNLIHYFILNEKSIFTVKETKKLSPNWIHIKRKKKTTSYLNGLKALSIQVTWENETWLHYSWIHLHLSSESPDRTFHCTNFQPFAAFSVTMDQAEY